MISLIYKQHRKVAGALTLALFLCQIQNVPAFASNAFTEGVTAFGDKNYGLALTKLAIHLKTNPQDSDANYYLASTYHHLGRTAEARRQYEYILRAFPGTTAASYATQGLTSLNSVVTKPAAALAVTVAEKDPDEDRVPLRRGPGGHLIVRAELNGKPLEMLFDTGASTTCVTLDAWRRLGNPVPTGAATDYVRGVGGKVGVWKRDADFALGKFKRKLEVTILPEMMGENGLVGQNFFQDLQYNLSGNADYIHIFAKGSQTASRSIPMNTIDIPFTKLGNNLQVDVLINGKACKMYFDTGASGILVDSMTAAMLNLRPTGEYMVGQMGGVGAKSTVYYFNVESVALGDVVKRNIRIGVGGAGVCLLGQDFFKDRPYVIDNEKQCIHFFR